MRYRPEIDGLRAIAVIPVIFFHAGFELFSGGFIGVDVFFVISGYLITSIICADLQAGRFSLANFYERRARRILPALFFVVAVCIPFAWLWLVPDDIEAFARSVIAVATFWSNFLFWDESGYFSTANDLKPLIHTWSLAVEEQYYILFPLLLMLMWKAGKRRVLAALIGIAVISLGAAHWGAYEFPSAAFYLLPTRAWELLIGSFVAFYLLGKEENKGSQWLSLIGAGMVAYAIFAFDAQTPFPSLYTLVPTVGAAFVILFTADGTFLHRLLSNKSIVGIGLISYSAYLWHQPIFALSRHWYLGEPSTAVMVGLCLVSVLLAYLTWSFVERPFRNREYSSLKTVAYSASVLCTCFLAFGVFGLIYKPAMEIKVGSEIVSVPKKFGGIKIDGEDCSFPNLPEEFCRIEGDREVGGTAISLFVVGDSHARVLTEAIYKDRSLYTEFFDLSAGGCPFLLGLTVYIGTDPHRCTDSYQTRRLEFLAKQKGHRKVVVLAARWPLYLYGDGFDNGIGGAERRDRIVAAKSISTEDEERKRQYFQSLDATMKEVVKIADHIVFVLPTHTNGWNVPDKARRIKTKVNGLDALESDLSIPSSVVENRVKEFNGFIREFYEPNSKVTVIDPRKFTCSDADGRCYGFRNGEFMFSDADHLSLTVNQRVSSEISGILARLYQ